MAEAENESLTPEDDEWRFTLERITPEQVEALNKLLAVPWTESDIDIREP